MSGSAMERVLTYHEATKHHPRRYARSSGYLDWAAQPDPFRRFDGAPLIRLPIPADDDSPSYDAVFQPGLVRAAPLDLNAISRFFYLSLAISAWKQAGGSRWALRCNPSSGNLHPTEGYCLLPALEDLSDRPGIYHYAPREHGLQQRAALDTSAWAALTAALAPGSFLAGLSSVFWREAWKYGERAFRYCQHDVGHALGALRLAAAVLGWDLVVLEDLPDADVARLMGLDRAEDFAGAEREHPELLAVVFPTGAMTESNPRIRPAAIQAVADAQWMGRANALSPSRVDWEIIEEVGDAARKHSRRAPADVESIHADGSRAASSAVARSSLEPPHRVGLSAVQVIRQRRSGLGFDGRTFLSAATFYHMLSRLMPHPLNSSSEPHSAARRQPPWDAVSWRPRIDLLAFVHLVAGLRPGLYAFVRDADRAGALRAAMRPDFAWSRPPGCPPALPLHLLLEGDTREAAAHLSLGQAIAGDGAFSLGMLAEFETSLHRPGPWFYRILFWEAGLVGQVLYLEAEAAGVRATGIGAYFDDLVHRLAGLEGRAFQCLYHFAVGGPVEDPRITTLAAY